VTEKTAIHTRRKFSGELRRWLVRPRRRTAGQRWAAWAHAVSERCGRVTERHGASDLVLARLPLVHRLQQRWLVSSQRFFPRITLAIHPILRQTIWRGQTLLVPDAETTATKSGDRRRLTTRPFSSQPAFLWSAAIPDAASPWTVEEARRQIFDHMSNRAFVKGASQLQAPLQLAFRRLFGADESILLKGSQIATEASVRALGEHIVRQSYRVEERVAETAAVVMRRPPAVEMAPTMPTNQHPFVTTAAEQSWRQDTSPPPALDLERITDQVVRQLDRRVVALRERLGKV